MIQRGCLHWVDLGEPRGSAPGHRRPVLVVQSDAFNASRLSTTLAVIVTSNTALAGMPGNVFLPASATGLPADSVANVSALVSVNKADLDDQAAGHVPDYLMEEVARGLRRILTI